LKLHRWSQKQQCLLTYTLDEWLNGDEHERSSVVLFSAAEVGKSKLSHLIAQAMLGGPAATILTILTIVPGEGLGVWSGGAGGADHTDHTDHSVWGGSWGMVSGPSKSPELRAGGGARAGPLTILRESPGVVWSVWSVWSARAGASGSLGKARLTILRESSGAVWSVWSVWSSLGLPGCSRN
jgi:hypothetical protein